MSGPLRVTVEGTPRRFVDNAMGKAVIVLADNNAFEMPLDHLSYQHLDQAKVPGTETPLVGSGKRCWLMWENGVLDIVVFEASAS